MNGIDRLLDPTKHAPLLKTTDIVHAREVAKRAAQTLKPLRTEQTTRHLAKKMASEWWEESIASEKVCLNNDLGKARTAAFRAMWPDRKLYVTICWPHFYKAARSQLINMLHHDSGISGHLKERIHAAVIEDQLEKGNYG